MIFAVTYTALSSVPVSVDTQCKNQCKTWKCFLGCFSPTVIGMSLLTLKLTREGCILAIDLNPEKLYL